MAEISPLRRCLIKDMATRNLSPATQQSYICAIAKFSPPFRPLRTGWDWRMCVPTSYI